MTAPRIDETTPIFSCECAEPSGTVIRHVYPMTLTPHNLERFWEHTKEFKVLFDGEVSGDFKKFCEMFISVEPDYSRATSHGLFWRIDDFVGVYYMTHIQAHDAQIHYSFFDRRHKGRQSMTRMMIQHVFNRYGFRRLSAEIPYFADGTFKFIEEVGLNIEGRKRKSVLFDGEWFDARCYSVLREDSAQWPKRVGLPQWQRRISNIISETGKES